MAGKLHKAVLLERLKHIIGQGTLQGLTSPAPTTIGRMTDAAHGAVEGAIRGRAITPDNITQLQI